MIVRKHLDAMAIALDRPAMAIVLGRPAMAIALGSPADPDLVDGPMAIPEPFSDACSKCEIRIAMGC